MQMETWTLKLPQQTTAAEEVEQFSTNFQAIIQKTDANLN